MDELKNLTFILGGARSGKSTYAENLARAFTGNVLYAATAEYSDDEMKRRIALHQAQRPKVWKTLETPHNLAQNIRLGIEKSTIGLVLVDCIAVFASNCILKLPDDCTESVAQSALNDELLPLLLLMEQNPAVKFVVVSNEVGLGIVPPYYLGRMYRDVLGRANQKIAQCATKVVFMVSGLPLFLK